MNVIKTQKDAINFLQIGETGDEILDQLDKLPHLIVIDTDDAVSSTMNDEEESENEDNWAPLPEGLFDDDSDDEDDDIKEYTRPYEEAIS